MKRSLFFFFLCSLLPRKASHFPFLKIGLSLVSLTSWFPSAIYIFFSMRLLFLYSWLLCSRQLRTRWRATINYSSPRSLCFPWFVFRFLFSIFFSCSEYFDEFSHKEVKISIRCDIKIKFSAYVFQSTGTFSLVRQPKELYVNFFLSLFFSKKAWFNVVVLIFLCLSSRSLPRTLSCAYFKLAGKIP